jgi:hypothetical protein
VSQYFNQLLDGRFDPEDEIVLNDLKTQEYLRKLGKILREFDTEYTSYCIMNHTKSNVVLFRVLQNYVVVHAVMDMLPYLSQPFSHFAKVLSEAFLSGGRLRSVVLGGEKENWETCLDRTKSSLSLAYGALFADRYFAEEDKQEVHGALDFRR